MKRYPAFLELDGQRAVVAGGGPAAQAKARLLAAAGADLLIVAPNIDSSLKAEFADRAGFLERSAVENDFAGATLAVIALDDPDLEARLAEAARRQGALVNVVDKPALSDFSTPALVDRGDVVVAISTGGAAPALARALRAKIEALLPIRLGKLARFAASFRAAVKAKIDPAQRRRFWDRFFAGPIAARVLTGDEARAREDMLAAVNLPEPRPAGVVDIVGAGPGDPELLTLRAHRLLQEADVILYDRLVGEEILALARRDAECVYVGKTKADHAVPQSAIEARMIALARAGKRVVRLKGGDPFVFGRGGEELETLRAAGVAAFVTPGVTAAVGCAAAAGMPLTHRDYAQAVTFITGHAKGNAEPDLDWAALAALKNTLVVYMGVSQSGRIAERLIAHGRAASTPIAVIENGARENQRILTGVLGELGALVEEGEVKGPAVLVVGEVACFADGETLDALIDQERFSA
ncbi:MAG: siroheme synthase CysG [Parvularculaceae bacterium]